MDLNITARPAAVAAAMDRAGECYDGSERRVTERRAVPPVAPDEDLLEVARTLCAIAERMSTMTAEQLQLYPSPTCEGSPVLLAARAAIVKRGFNPDGTAVPGRAYPVAKSLLLPLSAGLPSPDEHDRVLIHTEGHDFAGQQYFDIKTEDLWEREHQREEVEAATHWCPLPR